jgi:hypothetical protein
VPLRVEDLNRVSLEHFSYREFPEGSSDQVLLMQFRHQQNADSLRE